MQLFDALFAVLVGIGVCVLYYAGTNSLLNLIFSEKNKLASLYKDLEIRFQKENLLVINTYRKLKREFEKNPELSWISKDDSHPNKMANEIIATIIMINKKLVPHLGCCVGNNCAFFIVNFLPDSKLYTVLCSAP